MTNVHDVSRQAAAPAARSAPRPAHENAEAQLHGRLAEITERRESSAWCGSLEDADMIRLASVIENMLLPRVLRAYRPSDGLPLERCLG